MTQSYGTGRAASTPIGPRPAWTLRALLSGHHLNGELEQLSEPWKTVARRLAEREPDERQAAWQDFLNFQHDADAIIRAVAAVDPSAPCPDDDEPPFSLDLVNSSAFFARHYPEEWLIEDVCMLGEISAMAGPMKMLKTTILLDKVISIATASPFLGRFCVPRPRRCAFVSGESGPRTIQANARHICRSKGIETADLTNVLWGFTLPELTNPRHLQVIGKAIRDNGIEYLPFDPFYLMVHSGKMGVDPKDMFQMGPVIRDIAAVCLDAGCTPDVCHHFTKKRDDPFGPPSLDETAFGAFGQAVRQWTLIAPRERFDAEIGLFRLHFLWGGSAGHGGELALDIEVGKKTAEHDGRCWKVSVATPSEERASRIEQRKAKAEQEAIESLKVKAVKKDRTEREEMGEALAVFDKQPDHRLSTTQLRNATGWGLDKAKRILFLLVERRHVREVRYDIASGNGAATRVEGFEVIPGGGPSDD